MGDDIVDKIIDRLLEEVEKSIVMDCVPIGAVVVNNDKIIGYGHNEKEKSKCSVDHAEILAIKMACKHINDWRLDDCKLYVTLHPCLMCIGATNEARIKEINYFVDNASNNKMCKDLFNDIKLIKLVDKWDFERKLKDFFKKKR